MNKFIAILILQNILALLLFAFIPVYLIYKKTTNVTDIEFILLVVFIGVMMVILILDNYLISDPSLSFGFLRFLPFLLLYFRLNSLLIKRYSDIDLSTNQKSILLVHLMNNHALLSDENYFNFSRFIDRPKSMNYEEFRLFAENSFWVAVHSDTDHYTINKNLFTSLGLKYNEKRFGLSIIGFFILYIIFIAFIIIG